MSDQATMDLGGEASQVSEERLIRLDKEISATAEQHDLQLREYPIEVLVHKYSEGIEEDEAEIFIPAYQREFIWKPKQQSRFIESLFLNLPVPPLFLGDTDDADRRGALEVIDGTQRLRTLYYFMADRLTLCGLTKIRALNDFRYSQLPRHWQRRFKAKAVRVAVLTAKIDEDSRREMFDRLNSGGTKLQPMEQRRGANDGPFLRLMEELAMDEAFRGVCPLPQKKIDLREYEEMILRFFAYADRATDFEHEVDPFLTAYLKDMNDAFNDPTHADSIRSRYTERFNSMVEFIGRNFPNGFRKEAGHKAVPRVRFEAIAVGTTFAIEEAAQEGRKLVPAEAPSEWLNSDTFKRHTRSDATNSRPKLLERLWFVRDKLLGREPERARLRGVDEDWKNLDLF